MKRFGRKRHTCQPKPFNLKGLKDGDIVKINGILYVYDEIPKTKNDGGTVIDQDLMSPVWYD